MKKLCLMLLLFVLGVPGSMMLAQEKMNPLVNLLSYVPASPEAQAGEIMYANYAAMLPPYEAFAGTTTHEPVEILINRGYVGSEFFQYALSDPAGIVKTTGVDPFGVQTLLMYGVPPSRGLVLTGGFTAEAVNEAHRSRDYVEETLEEFTLWCGDASCEGTKQNLADRDLTNLFDMPPLGRKPPVAVSATAILSSYDVKLVKDGIEAHAARIGTLADLPEYGMLANALTQDAPGELIQAYILPTALIINGFPVISADMTAEMLDMAIFGRGDPAVLKAFTTEVADYGTLPAFSVLAFADYFDGTDDVTVIALVYHNAELAQNAADEVAKRLENFHDVMRTQSATGDILLDSYGVTDIETSVFTAENSVISVARIAIKYPQPEDEGVPRPQTGVLFRVLLGQVFRRTFYPLWQIDLPE